MKLGMNFRRSAATRRRGFTLLEIVVALGILAVMMAFAWPLMQNQISASSLPESAAHLRDTLFMARSEAALNHRRVRIRFEPEKQTPIIEMEKDPIEYPGEWLAVESPWTRERILLEDVQVHDIEMGRPLHLRPISFDESADQAEEDAEEEQDQEDTTEFDAASPNAPSANEDIEIDDNRPIIMFEADGSCDWYTIKLTRVPLEQELTDDDKQTWIVLDGRTGLASVAEPVTEEQLADTEFYIDRKNLEMPEESDPNDLAFQTGDQTASAGGGPSGGAFGGGSPQGQGGQPGGGQQGAGVPGGLNGMLQDAAGGKMPNGGQIPNIPGMPGNGRRQGGVGQRGPQLGGGGGGNRPNDGGAKPGDLGSNGGRPGMNNGGSDGKNPHENGNNGNESNPPNNNANDNSNGGVKGKDGDTGGKDTSNTNAGDNANGNLKDDLDDSDLTDEERENIKNGLNGGNNG